MEELYLKKIKCPVCNNQFVSSKVRKSKLRIDKKDSDFFTYYKGENPIIYDVYICPECGYAALDERFDKIGPTGKELIKSKISNRWNKRDYSGQRSIKRAIECYKLALYCGQVLEFKKFEIGKICIRIAWLYRLKGDEEERRFLSIALEKYLDTYEKESLSRYNIDELTIEYLIGDIYRRLGNYKDAIIWFGKVVSSPYIKGNPAIEKLAREQWHLAKEMYKEEGV